MNPDFDQLVDGSDLSPEDRLRLRRVHEMLVAAGPPAELPVAIGTPPAAAAGGAEVVPFPVARRRPLAMVAVAAAVAAACFGGGYVLAHQAHSGKSAIHVVRVVPMQGEQNSQASLRLGTADGAGNLPMQLTVKGLTPLPEDSTYYLILWRNGKPAGVCGTFEVGPNGPTTVTFNVAYKITKDTKWVVTRMDPGATYPGHVVMTTS